jgi:hypothetical protein
MDTAELVQDSRSLFGAVSDALSDKGVRIDADQLEAFSDLLNSEQGLGISIDTTINVPIVNGSGSYSTSYTSLWFTVDATLTITAPQNSDQWQVTAEDDFNQKTIWSGVATYNQPVHATYKTGRKIELKVSARNQSEPSFNGTLSVNAKISI